MDWTYWLHQIPIAPAPEPLLIFGVILIAGCAAGWLARRCHLPSIMGNLLAGVLIGPYMLGVVPDEQTVRAMTPLSMFAMGLIMVSIGGHLSWRRIHNAWIRIFWIALLEVVCSVLLVAFALHTFFGLDWPVALLLGTLAGDTAPATIIHISRETRAKGPFVKTLLSVVALDNIFTITLFVVVLTLVADFYSAGAEAGTIDWFNPAWRVLGALCAGLLAGRVTELLVRRAAFRRPTTLFIAILLASGLSAWLGFSPLLTCLFFGIYLSNSGREAERQLYALDPIEGIIYSAFFTLAGVKLHLSMLPAIGAVGVAFVLLRIAGKSFGAVLGGLLAGASRRIWRNIPLCLIPQAGVAIALVVLLQEDTRAIPNELREYVGTLVLAAVVINEFIGPLSTRLALRRAGETDKGRARLVEFIQEEFIKTDLVAKDKTAAIRQLCDFLIRTHRVEHVSPDELFETVMERERTMSTAIGHGAAIPHGTIEEGPEIQGVLGICRQGVDFDAPDGEPVRIMMLIVTPKNHRTQHLQVLAALSALISHHEMRSSMLAAADANAVWEIIESEDTPDYNYFLEDKLR